ncbi:MAG: hypothetical protein LRY50_10890 [Geovibrio sp.]|jgi:hypothetical protein|uniref:hypothetical protein n=1 Tax=Geovibrio ferrireducens TaxID=46201 RepID=UPI002244FF74|nr:hypothetical protein [Geovibrio ferrireducens]MCD8490697.1 hypothetical protein [Geovibrio sp.]MCD8568795.1 hypothetical protein [Geovibrio sp.]
MILNIHEKIRVGAVFDGGFPKPVWFGLHGEKVLIKEVCYKWKEREGTDVIYKFTVTDGFNIFEIMFSSMEVCWYLVAMDEAS